MGTGSPPGPARADAGFQPSARPAAPAAAPRNWRRDGTGLRIDAPAPRRYLKFIDDPHEVDERCPPATSYVNGPCPIDTAVGQPASRMDAGMQHVSVRFASGHYAVSPTVYPPNRHCADAPFSRPGSARRHRQVLHWVTASGRTCASLYGDGAGTSSVTAAVGRGATPPQLPSI